ncbi:MAG TPA: CoA protein activase [bacterium (Candidatus Stahlbacteria)]|nr:CoA protein activase [Candidatus Stahlbacteria bacterium]
MKIAFPHMGNLYIPFSALLENLGCEVVIPPRPTRKSIELGVKYSPEFVCFPYKVNLGDLINALEMGADTLLSVGGSWACRFGYYGRLHHETLWDLGYKFESIIVRKDGAKNVFGRVKQLNGNSTSKALFRAVRAVRIAWTKSVLVDKAEWLARRVRPYEVKKGNTTKALKASLNLIHQAKSLKELRVVRKKIYENFRNVEQNKSRDILRVKLVGETHIVLEPFVNFEIERRLGEMGVYVEPFLTIHRWLIHPFHLGIRGRRGESVAKKFARPFLAHPVGGEEELSIGYTVLAAIDGYDGVIHLHPFTCMPENVAKEILPRLSRLYDIPVMSLSIDEHTGSAGFISRLEAFVDLMKQRRKRQSNIRHKSHLRRF